SPRTGTPRRTRAAPPPPPAAPPPPPPPPPSSATATATPTTAATATAVGESGCCEQAQGQRDDPGSCGLPEAVHVDLLVESVGIFPTNAANITREIFPRPTFLCDNFPRHSTTPAPPECP